MTAYDPNNPQQQQLLTAINKAEGSPGAFTGYGNVDLTNYSRDVYGFPMWAGGTTSAGPTHAAGQFQFQPATWDSVAQAHNLNFNNPQDQSAGAWYLAQDQYAKQTGGDLQTALQNNTFDPSTLHQTWAGLPSSTGVQTAANDTTTDGSGNTVSPGWFFNNNTNSFQYGVDPSQASPTGPSGTTPSLIQGMNSGVQKLQGVLGAIENWIERFALIVIGIVIVAVALWALLSQTGAVPSPRQTAKAVL
jgi:hypothetical protein